MKTLTVAFLLFILACSADQQAGPTRAERRPRFDLTTPSVVVDSIPVILAAGDIANCGTSVSGTNDNRTGDLVRRLLPSYPNAIVSTLGDNAYKYGRLSDYLNCYDPAWGSFKAITRPVIGNHEYDSSSVALGYSTYFGAAVGPNKCYQYSYNVGATWHVVVVNSYSPICGTRPGSAQDNWLIADLAANTRPCIVGLMHHSRFYSTTGTNLLPATYDGFTYTPWLRLYNAHARLIVSAHSPHAYERYTPLRPDGTVDNVNGIREIIAGTGGGGQAAWNQIHPASEVHSPMNTFGVVRVRLEPNRYVVVFEPAEGSTFTDSVSATCDGSAEALPSPAPSDTTPSPPTDSVCTVAFLKGEMTHDRI